VRAAEGAPAAQTETPRRPGGVPMRARHRALEAASVAEGSAPRFLSASLVGRDEELATLREAASHAPALLLVSGEAGVGKTRLVDELLRSTEFEGYGVYTGSCQHLGEPLPLGALLEALRTALRPRTELSPVVGALQPLLPELAHFLPPALAPLRDRPGGRHRLFRALRELLSSLGRSVVLLEDLHWADEQTLEFLRFLCPQLPPELTLVCTYRGEDVAADALPLFGSRLPSDVLRLEVSLSPLERGVTRTLAEAILKAEAVSDELTDYLFAGSGGLPFAVEEVLRPLGGREDLIRRRGARVRRSLEDLNVPKAVRDAILERLGTLRPSAQALVQAAAIVGSPASEALLARVAAVRRGSETALGEALAAALVVEVREDRFCLRHELARRTVEEALPSPIRRQLHLRAAQALEKERPKPLARLAHHYRIAGKTEKWTRYAEETADRARSLDDAVTAYCFLRDALDVATLSPARRARLAVKFLTEASDSLAEKGAAEVIRPLLEESTLPPGVRGELRLHLGRFLCQAGEDAEGRAQIRQALGLLHSRPALAASGTASLAQPSFYGGTFDEHLRCVDRAVHEAARVGDQALRIRLSADRARTLLVLGDAGAWRAIDEIPAPGSETDELRQAARAWGNLADALLHLGYHERARELIGRNLAAGPDCFRETVIAQVTAAQLDYVSGNWTGLDERVRHLLQEGEDRLPHHADLEAVLGLLRLAHGEVGVALRTFKLLSEEELCDIAIVPWVCGGYARIKLAQDKPDAALTAAARAIGVIEEKGVWTWATDVAPVTVEALIGTGRQVESTEFVERFREGVAGRRAPAATAALRMCQGLLANAEGDLERATRAYASAERHWRALPRPYEAARACEYRGQALLAERPEQGRDVLLEATEGYRALGARWDVGRVRATLREHGLTPPHRAGRKGYGRELSPREHEVVRLASDGLSNREIALSLTVSRSAVEHHVSSALRKLGATSRHELGDRLGALSECATAAK
jgi:DNA-binding CsgD family transcriptional regulator